MSFRPTLEVRALIPLTLTFSELSVYRISKFNLNMTLVTQRPKPKANSNGGMITLLELAISRYTLGGGQKWTWRGQPTAIEGIMMGCSSSTGLSGGACPCQGKRYCGHVGGLKALRGIAAAATGTSTQNHHQKQKQQHVQPVQTTGHCGQEFIECSITLRCWCTCFQATHLHALYP